MKKIAVDLHIHSALSPCGEAEMTPNNIVNMAIIKELDYIAVTDHNSAKNLPAIMAVAARSGQGLGVLPGIEVTTKEEAHVLAYFDNLAAAMALDKILYQRLPPILNQKDLFGPQLILDEDDQIIGEVDKLLISATDIGIDELDTIVKNLKGVLVPAHIDRKAYSIVASLGFIPPDLSIHTCEVSKRQEIADIKKKKWFLKDYAFIQSSDAHQLEDMAEREYFVEIDDMQKKTLLAYLGGRSFKK